MLNQSDLSGVKQTALLFLHMPIEETPVSPIVVQHPIFETGIFNINKNGDFITVNLLEDTENTHELIKQYENKFKNAKSVSFVYSLVRKSYRLAFLKYVKKYLSKADFSELFADAWVSSENPNQDVNVRLSTLASWFKQADKKVLMTEEDYAVYESLPSTLTVYRGVAVGRNPKGLSWTANYDTAKWFANRFNKKDKKGYIQKVTIDKSRVLAYFNTRNEDEIVVDTRGLEFEIMENEEES